MTNKIENPIVEVPKPWGKEVIWAATDKYAGRILFLRAGSRTSLHVHEVKDKTLFLIGGVARLFLTEVDRSASHECEMSPSSYYHVPAGLAMYISAITDTIVIECSSTPNPDVTRLEDVYGRVPTNEENNIVQSV